MMNKKISALLLASFLTSANGGFFGGGGEAEVKDDTPKQPDDPVHYGVDVSFPIHHETVSKNYASLPHNLDESVATPKEFEDMPVQPLGNRQKFYDDFLSSCVNSFGKRGQRCISNEEERVAMSLRQPQSMENYTDVGYKKIRAPEAVFSLIKEFWDKNKDKGSPENWGFGNTYTNNWEVPTKMVSVEDRSLRGGGSQLKKKIWDAARDVIQEWTGQELTECSLYGIRIYYENSILATHVDRLPLVSSAIINVAQDVDEPWPLEVYGHDGKATNVTMLPGDMVLYESHSVLHGRPFPLKGRFLANIFIHFEPVGHSIRHNAKTDAGGDVDAKYRDSLQRGAAGHESDLPSYIKEGSPEEKRWRQQHPNNKRSERNSSVTGSTVAHKAAQRGDVENLQKVVSKKKDMVHAKDKNGWTPLHEGARYGHVDVVKYLVENGGDVNERTGSDGEGGSVLWWAKRELSDDEHPVITLLESMGAIEIGPDL
jgi:prolyl 4-hydroxylase